MTKLLVSVRDAWEAGEALAGGVDVIDVKEPQFGSLGAASAETRRAVQLALHPAALSTSGNTPRLERPAVPLSAACGELLEYEDTATIGPLNGYAYAKIGLAGCAALADWKQRWRSWIADLPAFTAPVAVVYADYQAVAAPYPWDVLEEAFDSAVQTLLIDTCDKTSGDIVDRMTDSQLFDVIVWARAEGVRIALAGSITFDNLAEVLPYEPDWIAVRGAVCRGGRKSILDRELVKRFAMQLSTPSASNLERGNKK